MIAGIGLVPRCFYRGVARRKPACLTLALAAGSELTVPVSWALSLDIGGEYSGSVSGVMNTFGATRWSACPRMRRDIWRYGWDGTGRS